MRDGLTNTLMFGEHDGGRYTDSKDDRGEFIGQASAFAWFGSTPLQAIFGLPQHCGSVYSAANNPGYDLFFTRIDMSETAPAWWQDPNYTPRFQSEHSGGVIQFVMGDGSVQTLGSIDYLTYIDLSGRSEGDVTSGAAF